MNRLRHKRKRKKISIRQVNNSSELKSDTTSTLVSQQESKNQNMKNISDVETATQIESKNFKNQTHSTYEPEPSASSETHPPASDDQNVDQKASPYEER